MSNNPIPIGKARENLREKVWEIFCKNPDLSQKQLAEKAGITLSWLEKLLEEKFIILKLNKTKNNGKTI